MDDNTWTDHGSVGVPPAPGAHTYAAIDQNILTDESDPYAEDTSHSLFWGSFNAALYGMTLSASNPLEVIASQEPQVVIQDQPVAVSDPNGFHGRNRTEGSFHWKAGPTAGTGQGWYYYFYSRGSCCSAVKKYAYVTEVCRAKSAQGPRGPMLIAMARLVLGKRMGRLMDPGLFFWKAILQMGKGVMRSWHQEA